MCYFIEEKYIPGKAMYVESILNADELDKYDSKEINYVLLKLNDTNYVTLNLDTWNGVVTGGTCGALTWDGHAFLDNIRGSQAWNYAKKNCKKYW